MTILLAVSLPRHPTTGNAFRAPAEAAGLAFARDADASVEIVHVSQDASPEDLRLYAGFEARVTLLRAADPCQALADYARQRDARLVLMGRESAMGLGSGMLPYALAARLGWPLVPDIRALTAVEAGWRLTAALPHGRSIDWTSDGPAVATLGRMDISPGLPSFAKARHQEIAEHYIDTPRQAMPDLVPARPRPAPIRPPVDGDYAARLLGHLAPSSDGTGRLLDDTADALAQDFLAELRRLGFHPRA